MVRLQRFVGDSFSAEIAPGYEYNDFGYWKEYPTDGSMAQTYLQIFGIRLNTLGGTVLGLANFWKVTKTETGVFRN